MADMDSLKGVIITLMVIGILLGLGFMILDELGTSLDLTTVTVGNETFDPTGNGYLANTYNNVSCWDNFAIQAVTNVSAGYVIDAANYSSSADGRIWNITGTELPPGSDDEWNVNYTYQWSNSEACKGIEGTKTALNKIPTWLSIVLVLLIVGILLTIVFKVLPNKGGSGGTTAEI